MKTKMKRQGSTELPRFAAGALAIAGASAANGATVQISFANNVVSTSTGLTLFDADLSGDEAADVKALSQVYGVFLQRLNYASIAFAGKVNGTMTMRFVDNGLGVAFGDGVSRGLVGFNFSDNGMNGGLVTAGWLDVSAAISTASGGSKSVQIHRLIFDDASTTAPTGLTSASTGIPEWQVSAVPEPGSNLALLALGAGGLTLRRRLKRAA
jgi:hypothetical protein